MQAFHRHLWFGLGDISSLYSEGDWGLGTPALQVEIIANQSYAYRSVLLIPDDRRYLW